MKMKYKKRGHFYDFLNFLEKNFFKKSFVFLAQFFWAESYVELEPDMLDANF